MVDRISSDESEGFFEEFIEDRLEGLIDDIVNDGDLERIEGVGGELIVEMDDISPPTFVYGDGGQGGGAGPGTGEPGEDAGKLRFDIPFERFMELVKKRLNLPDLKKEGKGSIKQVSYKFKTFGPTGVILDKKRTFKRAFKTSIGMRKYDPEGEKFLVEIQRRDRRYKLPQREEIPKYKAVVFYIGDISYSTYGERLELEKRLLSFVHHWLDYNYGKNNVDHRFFVHDVEAYEVSANEFYNVSNIGGTRASIAFDLVAKVARNEYDISTTNLYAFYVGDGELFQSDANEIVHLLGNELIPAFNRVCLVEVKPSKASLLKSTVEASFKKDPMVRTLSIERNREIIPTIQRMFGSNYA